MLTYLINDTFSAKTIKIHLQEVLHACTHTCMYTHARAHTHTRTHTHQLPTQ